MEIIFSFVERLNVLFMKIFLPYSALINIHYLYNIAYVYSLIQHLMCIYLLTVAGEHSGGGSKHFN